jgi:histidinol-phosphate aminotransferase
MTQTGLPPRANPWLNDIVSYIPGKPIEDVARELGLKPEQIIKLASNENPLGPSPKAVAAMQEALLKAHYYPDGGGYHLRTAIAQHFQLTLENVMLGNGSNEIIEFLGHAFLQPGDNIIVADHAFVIYKLMAHLFGAKAIEVPDPELTADVDAMAGAVTSRTKLIYLANPNNPTGTMVNDSAIEHLIEQVSDEVIIVLDEAYYEFLPDPPPTLRHIHDRENVILLRTFSKIQGLAALRIGYGLAHPQLIRVLQKCRQPFNANAIGQIGAIAGLQDTEHQERTRRVAFEGRRFLEEGFRQRGLEYVPSSANFVLVKVGNGQEIFQKLLRRGTIVRATGEYKLPEWVRVSVGTMDQNRRFFADLDAVLAESLGKSSF